MVSLSNSVPNGKLNMSIVKDAIFNEEVWKREIGMIDQSGSQTLVSQENRKIGESKERG